eukprot:12839494-Ditylum_brightwellii.AAC.1
MEKSMLIVASTIFDLSPAHLLKNEQEEQRHSLLGLAYCEKITFIMSGGQEVMLKSTYNDQENLGTCYQAH